MLKQSPYAKQERQSHNGFRDRFQAPKFADLVEGLEQQENSS